jgi:hypothetical protein
LISDVGDNGVESFVWGSTGDDRRIVRPLIPVRGCRRKRTLTHAAVAIDEDVAAGCAEGTVDQLQLAVTTLELLDAEVCVRPARGLIATRRDEWRATTGGP